jgi:hypothetical protein
MRIGRLRLLPWVVLVALAALLSACGAPQVVVVTATPSLTPAVVTVVVTPEPPTPTVPASPTTMPEEERIPVVSPIVVSRETRPDDVILTMDIPFRDADGDANWVHYTVVSTTNPDIHTEDGTVDVSPEAQKQGSSVTGTWSCGTAEYTVVLAIEIHDAAGHRSVPRQVSLLCPGIEPTATPVPATPTITPTPEEPPTPEPTWTPAPVEPAKITGTLPETIPCQPWNSGECLWEWTITFTNDGSVDGTIERISIQYIEPDGTTWIRQGGEWSTEDILVSWYGAASYDSWAGSDAGSEGELRGATLRVGWEGTDALGNSFSGSTTALLATGP